MTRLSKIGIAWLIVYFTILCFIVMQYISITNATILDDKMVYDLFENRQKLLFNNTIFFGSYLYICRINFLNPELLVRYKKRIFATILKNGILSSAAYSVYSYIILLLVVSVLRINIGTNLIVPIIKLFIFCMYLYLVYVILYLKFANHILALTSNVVVNFLVLVSSIGIMYARGTNAASSEMYGCNMHWFVLALVNVVIIIFAYFLVRKREYFG